MPAWLDALAAHDARDEACVIVTVMAALGSAPREAGAKMIVSAAGSWDTIGGGNLEYESIRHARALLAGDDRAPVQREFPLGPALGQCCGGATTLLFEPVRPPAWTVALFGAGHVGRAVARLLGDLPCRLIWCDARPAIFPEVVGGNTRLRCAATAADVAALPAGAAVLIMTHDHATDFVLTEAALRRDALSFVGTIGSATKRARFQSRLRRAGMEEARLARLHCPIGLPGIGTKLPAEIAIAVAAQLLAARPREPGAPQPAAWRRSTPAMANDAPGCGTAGCGNHGCGVTAETTVLDLI